LIDAHANPFDQCSEDRTPSRRRHLGPLYPDLRGASDKLLLTRRIWPSTALRRSVFLVCAATPITELTATRLFGAGVHPMLVKDEIRPICNLPPDGNSTRNAAPQDILPFDKHIGFE
jgi:hypothetical protein